MKNRLSGLCLVAGLTLAAGTAGSLTGCSREETAPPTTDRTAGQVVDDKTLTASVKSALNNNPDYKFGDVSVDTMNATVQLSGFVNSDDQRTKAISIARGVAGVTNVEDKMTLKPAQ
jgi:hyperosmotically inducible protein